MDTKSGGCSEKCENSDKVGHNMTSSSRNEQCPGCGLNNSDKITVTVAPTTGGRFEISIHKNTTIESLKKIISKKLKVPKERILLLHKDRQLRDGSLEEHSISNGSTVTLLPSVETGLLSQRPEQGVMQALESLNDSQVNDFLSGKAPLNLTMRLGDHMMLIQLQLSSVTPSSNKKTSSSEKSNTNSDLPKSIVITTNSQAHVPKNTANSIVSSENSEHTTEQSVNSEIKVESVIDKAFVENTTSNKTKEVDDSNDLYSKINTILQNNYKLKRKMCQFSSPASSSNVDDSSSSPTKRCKTEESMNCEVFQGSKNNFQNYKSSRRLNELLSRPKTPILDKKETTSTMNENSTNLHKVIPKDEILTVNQRQELEKRKSELLSDIVKGVNKLNDSGGKLADSVNKCDAVDHNTPSTSSSCTSNCLCSSKVKEATKTSSDNSAILDTKALAEASRNLTQTLKQLSSEVLTCRSENLEESCSAPSATRRRPGTQGAIIESMKHHGKGVFSGTFSGTLNPALQDRFGRPKRDISTIIHILNDLLCATPQYRRQQTSMKTQTQDNTGNAEAAASGTDLVSVENEATRGKLEKLRMVMEQNRARRRARREARLPCTSVWTPSTPSQTTELSNVEDLDGSKQDATDLVEMNRPEPVTA